VFRIVSELGRTERQIVVLAGVQHVWHNNKNPRLFQKINPY